MHPAREQGGEVVGMGILNNIMGNVKLRYFPRIGMGERSDYSCTHFTLRVLVLAMDYDQQPCTLPTGVSQ